MTAVALYVNPQKLAEQAEVARLAREAVALFVRRGVRVVVNEDAAAALGHRELGVPDHALADRADVFVVFGGDGTILAAAREAAPRGIPILGVNLGGFGFLAEVSDAQATEALDPLLAGDYHLDERMMLRAEVRRDGRPLREFLALNDIVVTKSGYARLLRVHASVNDTPLATYGADGLIVATPTGSTAYSLSAGGPIVHPSVPAMVVTPICPHTLTARAVVISADDVVAVRLGPAGARPPAILTVDGQEGITLAADDEVRVERSPHRARLIRFGAEAFYTVLRSKLGWGAR